MGGDRRDAVDVGGGPCTSAVRHALGTYTLPRQTIGAVDEAAGPERGKAPDDLAVGAREERRPTGCVLGRVIVGVVWQAKVNFLLPVQARVVVAPARSALMKFGGHCGSVRQLEAPAHRPTTSLRWTSASRPRSTPSNPKVAPSPYGL